MHDDYMHLSEQESVSPFHHWNHWIYVNIGGGGGSDCVAVICQDYWEYTLNILFAHVFINQKIQKKRVETNPYFSSGFGVVLIWFYCILF